jgi:hypothetical protein
MKNIRLLDNLRHNGQDFERGTESSDEKLGLNDEQLEALLKLKALEIVPEGSASLSAVEGDAENAETEGFNLNNLAETEIKKAGISQ